MNSQPIANGGEQLRDIKSLLEIPDSSYYLFWGLVIFAILLLAAVLFFAVKKYLEHRRANLAKKYLAKLHEINWSNPKESAYAATHYGRLLATDERRKELFAQLEPLLEQYKYKKEVDAVNDETLKKFKLYVQVADESV
jgi:hypothetical protein